MGRLFLLMLLLSGLMGCQLERPEGGEVRGGGERPLSPAPPIANQSRTPSPTTTAPTTRPLSITQPVSTHTPRALVSLFPESTMPPRPSPTAQPWQEEWVLGYSSQQRPIQAFRLGTGPRWLVLLGAMHGSHECNTYEMLSAILDRFRAEPELLPEAITLYVIPLINPDGCALDIRTNGNGVDLNRNWSGDDWVSDAEGPTGIVPGSGGSHPFSEQETVLLRWWLLRLQERSPEGQLRVISYHSAVPIVGMSQPAYDPITDLPAPLAQELATLYAEATGYDYAEAWVGSYTITGEFIGWAGRNGLIAVDVELAGRGPADSRPSGWFENHIQTNWRGITAVLDMLTAE